VTPRSAGRAPAPPCAARARPRRSARHPRPVRPGAPRAAPRPSRAAAAGTSPAGARRTAPRSPPAASGCRPGRSWPASSRPGRSARRTRLRGRRRGVLYDPGHAALASCANVPGPRRRAGESARCQDTPPRPAAPGPARRFRAGRPAGRAGRGRRACRRGRVGPRNDGRALGHAAARTLGQAEGDPRGRGSRSLDGARQRGRAVAVVCQGVHQRISRADVGGEVLAGCVAQRLRAHLQPAARLRRRGRARVTRPGRPQQRAARQHIAHLQEAPGAGGPAWRAPALCARARRLRRRWARRAVDTRRRLECWQELGHRRRLPHLAAGGAGSAPHARRGPAMRAPMRERRCAQAIALCVGSVKNTRQALPERPQARRPPATAITLARAASQLQCRPRRPGGRGRHCARTSLQAPLQCSSQPGSPAPRLRWPAPTAWRRAS